MEMEIDGHITSQVVVIINIPDMDIERMEKWKSVHKLHVLQTDGRKENK